MRLFNCLATVALTGTIVMAAPQAHADEDLKIGAIAAPSGGGTAWGLGPERGAQIASVEVNGAGGLEVGGATYKLRLIAYDDQYSAAPAKIAVDRLIQQDGVKFIIRPVGSPGALGSLRVTKLAKVPPFVDAYASGILKNQFSVVYIFRIDDRNHKFSAPIIAWIRQATPNFRKIGITAPNDATGQTAIPPLFSACKKPGFDVWVDYYERGTKEFTTILLRMQAQNGDLFDLNSAASGDAGLRVKQVRQIGFKGTVLQAGGAGVEEIMNIAGPLVDGFIRYDVGNEAEPQAKLLIDSAGEKYSKPMNGVVPIYYNATQILLEAMRRAGSIGTTKVRDEVEKLNGWNTQLDGPLHRGGKAHYGNDHQMLALGLAPIIVTKIDEVPLEIQAHKKLAVVLAEQNAHWAMQVATRAVIPELGRCVADGVSASLRRDPRVQAAYLGL